MRINIFSIICCFIFYLLFSVSVFASLSNQMTKNTSKSSKAEVTLLSAANTFNEQKTSILLGVRFVLFDNWKIYWRNPGVAGIPPEFSWDDSKNIQITKMLWPYPKRKMILGIESNVYEHEVIFPVIAEVLEPKKKAEVALTLNYILCRIDACIPAKTKLSLTLLPGDAVISPKANQIQVFLDKVPKLDYLPSLKLHSVELTKGQKGIPELLITTSSLDAFVAPEIFIEGPNDLFFNAPKLYRKLSDSKFQFVSQIYHNSNMDQAPKVSPLSQKVTITLVDQNSALEKTMLITRYETGIKVLTIILLIATLGGFILNFMPCVLPILFIKISDIINNSDKSQGRVRKEFLSTAVGILASFFVLALVAVFFKVVGVDFIWGVQFQQPLFIIFMMVILTFFACNFFGFFEFKMFLSVNSFAMKTHAKNYLIEHFFRGIFATLLATPCSAPFVGTALGFALSRSPFDIIIIFLAMGLGFASLYLLIAIFPKVIKCIPKPGVWMRKLQIILGMLLIGTIIWLLYILSMQLNLLAIVTMIALLIIIAAMLFIKYKFLVQSKKVFGLLIILLVFISFMIPFLTIFTNRYSDVEMSHTFWKPFNLERIPLYISQGKVVFVDVTATWCATCFYNKKFVLESPKVITALNQENIIAMRADWTNKSIKITRYLNSFDRHAIPFNVIYSQQYPQGIVLPELLTQTKVLNALEKASQSKP
ncbi:thioredoxin family protein [Thiotrichales bacterium 19X7-9]|nr:thioredoxin family protein [Thiotrichales bacterium 19X7-9]